MLPSERENLCQLKSVALNLTGGVVPAAGTSSQKNLVYLFRNHREAIATIDLFTVPRRSPSACPIVFSSSVTIVGASCTSMSQSIPQACGSSSSCEKHFHLDPLRGSSSLMVILRIDWSSSHRFNP